MALFKNVLLGVYLILFGYQTADAVCPSGWLTISTPPTTQCYKIFPNQRKSFNQAQQFCVNQQHGYLATDKSLLNHNALKGNIINTKLIANAPTTFWLGVTDNNTTGPWTWITGQPLAWQYFVGTPVNTPNKQDCGYVVSAEANLRWHVTNNCNQIKGVVCQRDFNASLVTARPLTTAPVICASGWTAFPQKRTCLRLYTDVKTWPQAKDFCKNAGGNLVKITDSAFNSFVDSLISHQIGEYWIGLNDQKQENKFEWLDETVQATFTYWATNEPNNVNGNENCVHIAGTNGYKWNDAPCDTRFRYICQQRPTTGVVPVTHSTTTSPNCYPGWIGDPNSDNCYQIKRDMMTWLDARTACQAAGGELASINSVQEQFFLTGSLMSYTGNFYWIGANDRATEKGFEWTDRSPFGFFNWNAGQPDNGQESDCVVLTRMTGRWDDLPCASRYGYICKRKGRVTSPTSPPLTSPTRVPAGKMWGCPPGWVGNRGYCYQLTQLTNGTTLDGAKILCARSQANVASIRDEAENRFIFSQIPRGYNGGAWIGLTDQLMENSFFWTDSTPVTYTNWNPGEPNNQNNEDCVTMLSYANGKWNDGQCNYPINLVVCKQPMGLQLQGTPPEQRGCATGATGYNAQCYSIIETRVNYNQAKANCRSRNGFLATVDNVQVQSFLSSQLFGRSSSAYWMGLSSTNRNYAWASGRPVSFTSWSNTYTGRLNNTCAAMQTLQPVGLWVDTNPCTGLFPYICESPRVGFTTPRPTVTTTSVLPCPAGWTAYLNKCYKAFLPSSNVTKSWMGARTFCGTQAIGATLISIPNANFGNWLKANLLRNVPGTYWIGLNDRDNEAGFVWTDNSPVTYTHWAAGEPNDYLNGEDCVAWSLPANTWGDSYCYIANSFICQVNRGAVVPTTRPTVTPGRNTPQCGNSTLWTQYHSYCYYVSPPSNLVSWFQARLACKDMSAELVSISSDDENGYVTTMISQGSVSTSFWIGLNDLEQETYSWTDISPISYINWNKNQPDDGYGGEQCVEIDNKGRWDDLHCQEKRGYVCKRRPGNFTPPPWTTPNVKGGCPRDFVSLPSLPRCYYVGGTTQAQRKTFNDSIRACASMAHKPELASIHTKLEEKFIITLIADLQWPAWIGFNDIKVRNHFSWVDNLDVDFTNWGLRQPDENLNDNNPQNRRDCVDLQNGVQTIGKWDDNRCVDRYAYVCEARKEDGLPTVAPNFTGCPLQYTRFRSSCYRYYPDLYNWTNAEGYCVSEGGHLVSLDSVAEQAFVEVLTQHIDAIEMWIGLMYSLASQSFAWSNGWPVSFTNWGTGEPDLQGMVACASHTVDGQWHDNPCVMKLPFVCEINQGQPPTPKPTIPVTSAACPTNWRLHGAYCYYQERNLVKSWPGANYACTLLGSVLLTIHTDDEAKFVTSMVTSSGRDTWIGLKSGQGLGFGWSDQSPVEYLYWGQNQPSDSDPTMHQVCVKASRQDGTWSDTDCFDNIPYICKKPSTLATFPTANPTQPAGQNTPYNPTQGGQNTPYNPNNTPYNPYNTPYNPNNTPYNPNNTPYNPGGQNTNGQVTPAQNTPGGQPATQKYTSDNGGGGSGMSGGSIAGIVIGCVAIVAVAVTIMFVARKYFNFQTVLNKLPFTSSASSSGAASGFDNATYSTTAGEKVNLQFTDA